MKYFIELLIVATLGKLLFLSDWQTVAALLVFGVVLIFNKFQDKDQTINEKLKELDLVISAHSGVIDNLQKSQSEVKKLAEESKKLISQAQIGLGFRATKRE